MNDKALDRETLVVLLDNGSLSSEFTLKARELARRLGERLGRKVDSVSVSHSDQVAAERLNGRKAVLWEGYIEGAVAAGVREILVIPLFVGPGFGLMKAKRFAEIRLSGLPRICWARCLVAPSTGCRLVPEMMANTAIELLDTKGEQNPPEGSLPIVLLVDHGSPYAEVAACRDYVASLLGELLANRTERVIACSMESRKGEAYAFNRPLLAEVLERLEPRGAEALILAPLFLFEGRHAGSGGDIDQICSGSAWTSKGGRISKLLPLGSNSSLIAALESRFLDLARLD